MRNRVRRIWRSLVAANSRDAPHTSRGSAGTASGLEGAIEQVDPVGRELIVRVGGVLMKFYVPLDCAVWLHDERVKLRLLQPMDHVRLVYAQDREIAVARSITVSWTSPEVAADSLSGETPAALPAPEKVIAS